MADRVAMDKRLRWLEDAHANSGRNHFSPDRVQADSAWASRSRKQSTSDQCNPSQIPARSQAVNDACCVSSTSSGGGIGHRRNLQADCNRLPDACPSLDCAEVYTSFFEDCPDMMLGDSKYQTFYTNTPTARSCKHSRPR